MEYLIQIILLLCLTVDIKGTETNPLLATKYGQLRGKTVTVKETDRAVHAFYGIPFAKAPVGPLRFAPPQPAEPWRSIRDATQQPPMCLQDIVSTTQLKNVMQGNVTMPPISEDCLFLNIFTPGNREKNYKLPVMVFIHGGGLVVGAASLYDGSPISAYENLVVVVIQYRLSVLGFFSTGDEHARGNYGLLDQVAALQWVQENIEDFGGDPQSVTIFGESAGAMSVAAHVLSPLSKGLFHKAICESGVAVAPALLTTKTERVVFFRNLVAKISGCESPDSGHILDCMKRKTEEELIELTAALNLTIIPACVDGIFLLKNPEEILAAKESNRVPFIIGVNGQEFGYVLPQILKIRGIIGEIDKDSLKSMIFNNPFLDFSSEIALLVFEEYFNNVDDPIEIRNRLIDLFGDISFVLPSIKTAKYHRDSGLPVYFYQFQHHPSLYDYKPDYVNGDHTDELISVFGGPFLGDNAPFNGPATDEEKALSRTVMKYWANFARNGDPNGPGLAEWSKYDEEEIYLEINLKQRSAKKLIERREEFWTVTLPQKLLKMQEEKRDYTEL